MRIFSFFALLLSSISLIGAVNYTISTPKKLDSKLPRIKVLGENAAGIAVLKYGKSDYSIESYDPQTMVYKRGGFISLPEKDAAIRSILVLDDGYLVYYIEPDKDATYIKAQKFDTKLNAVGASKDVAGIPGLRDLATDKIKVKRSENDQFTIFYFPTFQGGAIGAVDIIVCDRSGNQLKRHIFNDFRTEDRFIIDYIDVSNNADVVVVSKGTKKTFQKEAPPELLIQTANAEGILRAHYLSVGHLIFKQPEYLIDNQHNQLIVAGLYQDENTRGNNAHGYFLRTMNITTGAEDYNIKQSFSQDMMRLIKQDYFDANKQPSLATYRVAEVILREDKGALIMLESFYEEERETQFGTRLTTGFNSMDIVTAYHYNDILLYSVDGNGIEEWSKLIPKKQTSESDDGVYASFALVNLRDQLKILYNDDIYNRGALKELSLQTDGNFQTTSLFFSEQKDVMPIHKLAKQINPNEIVVPSYKKNTFKLIKLSY